jgi:hypothetical protein
MNVPAGTYRIRRGTQEFGPYDGGALERYIASGNIVMSDYVEANGSGVWIPLTQLVGYQPGPAAYPPVAPSPYMPQATPSPYGQALSANPVELPPNLHWALVLVLSMVPFFGLVWGFLLAAWARRLNGNTGATVAMAIGSVGIVAYWIALISQAQALGLLFALVGGIANLIAMFSIRSSMEEYYNSQENIGLSLSGVMTFFFNLIYLQYHVNRITRWKQTGILD